MVTEQRFDKFLEKHRKYQYPDISKRSSKSREKYGIQSEFQFNIMSLISPGYINDLDELSIPRRPLLRNNELISNKHLSSSSFYVIYSVDRYPRTGEIFLHRDIHAKVLQMKKSQKQRFDRFCQVMNFKYGHVQGMHLQIDSVAGEKSPEQNREIHAKFFYGESLSNPDGEEMVISFSLRSSSNKERYSKITNIASNKYISRFTENKQQFGWSKFVKAI